MCDPFLGEIRMFAGPRAPTGWMTCSGWLLPISGYNDLFSVIGTSYGGDGQTTFALPNLAGRLPMGYGAQPGLTPRMVMGAAIGSEEVVLTQADLPTHSHAFNATTVTGTSNSPVATAGKMAFAQPANGYQLYVQGSGTALNLASDAVTGPIDAVGGTIANGSHPNMMPTFAVSYIICVTGVFPPNRIVPVGSLTPKFGDSAGGMTVTINLPYAPTDIPSVMFGEAPAMDIQLWGTTTLTVTVPPGNGRVPVIVGDAAAAEFLTFTYAPSVSGIMPLHGSRRGGTIVTVAGTGFQIHDNPVTAVMFEGVAAQSFEVQTDGVLLAISPPGSGSVSVQVELQDGSTSMPMTASTFTYRPVVTGLSPNFGPPTGGTTVAVGGLDFASTDLVYFGETPVTPTDVTATSLLVVTPIGAWQARVSVGDPDFDDDEAVQFFDYAPAVTGLSESQGQAGDTLTVTGVNFSPEVQVQFGTVVVAPSSPPAIGATSLSVTVPSGVGEVAVTVTGNGGGSEPSAASLFSYLPHITALTPAAGPALGGTTVVVTGSNFAPSATVHMGGGAPIAATWVSATQLSFVTPAMGHVSGTSVSVINPGGTSPETPEFLFNLAVTGVAPSWGIESGPTAVTLTGCGFSSGIPIVYFGTTDATDVEVTSDTVLTCIAPAGTVDVNVTVAIGGITSEATAANMFTYQPIILSISPNQGHNTGNAQFTITGQSLGGGAVTVGGNATVETDDISATSIQVWPGSGSGTVPVVVHTLAGESVPDAASMYTFSPSVLGLEPAFGGVNGGGTITIRGVGLIGATGVTFGSVTATNVAVIDDTHVRCILPPGSGQVDVCVTMPTTATTPNPAGVFTYGPMLLSITPSAGKTGTEVTLTGSGFTGATTVWFGGDPVEADDFTIVSDTQITLAAPSGPAGSVHVSVFSPHGYSPQYTNGMKALLTGTYFTFPPAITSVAGPGNGNTAVTITGQGFSTIPQGVNTVSFNGGAPVKTWMPKETRNILHCPATPLSGSGSVTVTLTLPGGIALTSAPFQFNLSSEGV